MKNHMWKHWRRNRESEQEFDTGSVRLNGGMTEEESAKRLERLNGAQREEAADTEEPSRREQPFPGKAGAGIPDTGMVPGRGQAGAYTAYRNAAKGRKRGGAGTFFSGLAAGFLLCVIVRVLMTGYISIPFFGGNMLTLYLPTYELANSGDGIHYSELNRKLREMEHLIRYSYYYDIDNEALEEGIYTGLLYGLSREDHYAGYYTADDFSEEMDRLGGSYVGIGVTVQEVLDGAGLLVQEVTPGGPADEAGIKTGDRIIAVDGEDVRGLTINEITRDRIKGEAGTSVEITVQRGEGELKLTCERRALDVTTVYSSEVEYGGETFGYLGITEFEEKTEEQFKAALDRFETDGMAGVLIDLRENPGGAMTTCLDMLDYILPDDDLRYGGDLDGTLLLRVEDKYGNGENYTADDGHSYALPIVVLVNENSASASEIFSGTLQRYGYQVVGTTTYGKGIVQDVYMLSDGSGMQYTTAQYLLADGFALHGIGVTPDVTAEADEALLEKGFSMDAPEPSADQQLSAALDVLRGA